MSDLTDIICRLREMSGQKPWPSGWVYAEIVAKEAADALEAQEARIAVMIAALESAKEELYFSVHSGSDPDDPKNMDGAAMAYRECRDALTPLLK